ncbi:hypothetical protein AMAG_11942 [Allomyces macrogynus ATCC 38327]|uniref:HTH APSES-type domain-containing protein n=1 Tax=Allomyces macrogynus (strain ATCC 38327) TaxID=578462 RepID=A0A0L0SYB5_ALLM3|nr:hypothetical protein AMAG_11942 [Allomyces macrogynus ATCC 38327]|eukprot:KNE67481.1 hypothetical protein AMAG_11942 [Allomyces macrogynus ATCC 38327]
MTPAPISREPALPPLSSCVTPTGPVPSACIAEPTTTLASTMAQVTLPAAAAAAVAGALPTLNVAPHLTSFIWEEQNSRVFQLETDRLSICRRADNHFVNGTKLLNVTDMTRGKRDSLLKSEKDRDVIKTGPMRLKGVWIPLHRAIDLANQFGIANLAFPLLEPDPWPYVVGPHVASTYASVADALAAAAAAAVAAAAAAAAAPNNGATAAPTSHLASPTLAGPRPLPSIQIPGTLPAAPETGSLLVAASSAGAAAAADAARSALPSPALSDHTARTAFPQQYDWTRRLSTASVATWSPASPDLTEWTPVVVGLSTPAVLAAAAGAAVTPLDLNANEPARPASTKRRWSESAAAGCTTWSDVSADESNKRRRTSTLSVATTPAEWTSASPAMLDAASAADAMWSSPLVADANEPLALDLETFNALLNSFSAPTASSAEQAAAPAVQPLDYVSEWTTLDATAPSSWPTPESSAAASPATLLCDPAWPGATDVLALDAAAAWEADAWRHWTTGVVASGSTTSACPALV